MQPPPPPGPVEGRPPGELGREAGSTLSSQARRGGSGCGVRQREQAPQPAGRVSKNAPLLCPSPVRPPPLPPAFQAAVAGSSLSRLGSAPWTSQGPFILWPWNPRAAAHDLRRGGWEQRPWGSHKRLVTQDRKWAGLGDSLGQGLSPASGKGGGRFGGTCQHCSFLNSNPREFPPNPRRFLWAQ